MRMPMDDKWWSEFSQDSMEHFDPTRSTTNDVVRQMVIPRSRDGKMGVSFAEKFGPPVASNSPRIRVIRDEWICFALVKDVWKLATGRLCYGWTFFWTMCCCHYEWQNGIKGARNTACIQQNLINYSDNNDCENDDGVRGQSAMIHRLR